MYYSFIKVFSLHPVDQVVSIFYFDLVSPFYFLKWNPLQILCTYNFFWIKVSHQSPNFKIFECSGKNLLNLLSVIFQTISPFFFKFCITLQCYETWLLCIFFSSNIIYFVQKEPIKVQIFEIARVNFEIRQIARVNFETSQFLFKFCIILHCHDT